MHLTPFRFTSLVFPLFRPLAGNTPGNVRSGNTPGKHRETPSPRPALTCGNVSGNTSGNTRKHLPGQEGNPPPPLGGGYPAPTGNTSVLTERHQKW